MQVGSLQFSLMTYNVGTEDDHFIQASIRKGIVEENVSYALAEETARTEIQIKKKAGEQLLPETFHKERLETIRRLFERGKPDLICLQEVLFDHTYTEILGLLPGYEAHSETKRLPSGRYQERIRESIVAWNPEIFSKVSHLNVAYESYKNLPLPIRRRNPNTIVTLQHHATKKTIAVCSAHLAGFNLATNLPDDAQKGTLQLLHDLTVLNTVPADLYVYAGDLNATPRRNQNRLYYLQSFDYHLDNFRVKTAHDLHLRDKKEVLHEGITSHSPRQVKLDHIAVKTPAHQPPPSILQHEQNFSLDPLSDEFLASDHCPLMCWIKA